VSGDGVDAAGSSDYSIFPALALRSVDPATFNMTDMTDNFIVKLTSLTTEEGETSF
jgi:hypothetical protein